MKSDSYLLAKGLRPFIKKIVVTETPREQTYIVLPDTSLVIGFQYKGHLSYFVGETEIPLSRIGITGLRDTYRVFKNSNDIGTVLVFFKEGAAASFFNRLLHELFGESLSLDNLTHSSVVAEIEERLQYTRTDRERISIIEQFLITQLTPIAPDRLVMTALQHIHQSRGSIRITELAKKLHVSQSPLEKRFRKVVGSSPKKFASIIRMKYAMELLHTSCDLNFVAYEAGYFDQAHFTREFKSFTGTTPGQFLKRDKEFVG